jgi:hypothetical protein
VNGGAAPRVGTAPGFIVFEISIAALTIEVPAVISKLL